MDRDAFTSSSDGSAGTEIKIPTGQTDVGAVDAKQLGHRIRSALEAREHSLPAAASALARGSRPLGEWIGDLHRIGRGVVDHRTPAVPQEVLLRVVEDPSAAEAERASAALAAMPFA